MCIRDRYSPYLWPNRWNFRVITKSGPRNTMVTSDFLPEVKIRPFRACAIKICNTTLIYGWIAKIFALFRKSGSGNTMVMSDFSPEVEIRPFRACAMKNMQYKPYLWPNCPNVRVFLEIGVGEHDVDVRFFTGSGNTAISSTRNAFGHNYWNCSFIMDVDVAMGQIPRSTERISSWWIKLFIKTKYNKQRHEQNWRESCLMKTMQQRLSLQSK